MYRNFLSELKKSSQKEWAKLDLEEGDFVSLLRSRRTIEADIKNGRSCQRTITRILDLDDSNFSFAAHRLVEDVASWVARLDGYIECRKVSYGYKSEKTKRQQTVYFQPSVAHFLRGLKSKHPLLMVSTLEPQRMLEETVRHFTQEEDYQVFSWRITSGLRELVVVEGSIRQEPWANSKRAIESATWSERSFPQFIENLPPEISIGDSEELGDIPREAVLEYIEQDQRKKFKKELSENRFLSVEAKGKPEVLFRTSYGVSVSSDQDDKNEGRSTSLLQSQNLHIEVFFDDHDFEYNRDDAFFQEALHTVVSAQHLELASKTTDFSGFVNSLKLCTERLQKPSIFLFNDIHIFLSGGPGSETSKATAIAAISDAFHAISSVSAPVKIVLLGHGMETPTELREEINSVDIPLPNLNELFFETKGILQSDKKFDKYHEDEEFVVSIAESARGLTLAETSAVLKNAFENSLMPELHKEDLLESVRETKRTLVNRSPVLELYEADRLPNFNPGATEQFEEWLAVRKRVFAEPEKARNYGITERPKGVLLLGVPGSGKSLSAKIIARDWNLPLVRLDVGAIRDKWVGSSEARIRDALKTVEAMSPCVLWIDEIDKGMSEDDRGGSNSTDLNVRATLLTWMQENQAPVFVVATANKFKSLPPELTRAGRFDARFFFGCPGPDGRRKILHEHLLKHDINIDELFAQKNEEELLEATHGFTGAEIEQVVLDALYASFDGQRSLCCEDLEARAGETQPIIKFFGDELEQVWELIEQGRVELASLDMLKRSQVAQLIDPDLFRPMYCRKEFIAGFEKQASRAERLLMSSPFAGSRLIVLETGDPSWAYVQANFKFNNQDEHNYKLLEKVGKLGPNLVLETLIGEYGVERVLFSDEELYNRFISDDALNLYIEFYELIDTEEDSND